MPRGQSIPLWKINFLAADHRPPSQTYMLMIGAPVGDLVQFVKTGAGRGNGKRGPPAAAAEGAPGAAAASDDVVVSRVELDCRTYHHKHHWEETILPRLYSFARMVYRFRGDDLLRWRYLLATPVRVFFRFLWDMHAVNAPIARVSARGGLSLETRSHRFVLYLSGDGYIYVYIYGYADRTRKA